MGYILILLDKLNFYYWFFYYSQLYTIRGKEEKNIDNNSLIVLNIKIYWIFMKFIKTFKWFLLSKLSTAEMVNESVFLFITALKFIYLLVTTLVQRISIFDDRCSKLPIFFWNLAVYYQ